MHKNFSTLALSLTISMSIGCVEKEQPTRELEDAKPKFEEVRAENKRIKQRIREEVQEHGHVTKLSIEKHREQMNKLEDLGSTLDDENQVYVEVLARCYDEMYAMNQEHETVYRIVVSDQYFDLPTAIRENNFAWQYKISDDYEAVSNKMLRYLNNLPNTIKHKLGDRGVKENSQKQLAKEFKEFCRIKGKWQRAIVQAHIDCAKSYRQCIEFVDENRGAIATASDSSELVFDNPDIESKYKSLMQEVAEKEAGVRQAIQNWAENQ